MKILHYIFLLNFIHRVELCFVQNQYKPICANCKFYIPHKNECSKFAVVDIVTGEYSYESAIKARNDEDKCGEYAIYYRKNNFKFITIPYYFILENSYLVFLYVIGVFIPTITWFISYYNL